MAKKAKKPPTRPAMQSCHGYGIVGPYGNMWTSEVFSTPERARAHIANFWKGIKHDTSKYRIVWARQAAYFIRESRHPQ